MQTSGRIAFSIGGVALSLESRDPAIAVGRDRGYEPFLTQDPSEVALGLRHLVERPQGIGSLVFDSGGTWCLYRAGRRWIITLADAQRGADPYQLAVLESDFRRGDIYMEASRGTESSEYWPLGYPFAEVLMIHLLSLGRGVLLHACGVSDRGRGLLFAGASGAGKSTIAGLWEQHAGTKILSDDRVILREKGGRIWAYGTPWHGDARLCSPEIVPLEAVFFVRHGEENAAAPLQPGKAVSSLLQTSFPTFWNREGMAFTLGFLDQLSRDVPCYELAFVPDGHVVDFTRAVSTEHAKCSAKKGNPSAA